MSASPKVEFALGSKVSKEQFFKSSFAKSFILNYRDTKSLDYEFSENGAIADEPGGANNSGDNNFYSLMNFGSTTHKPNDTKCSRSVWKIGKVTKSSPETEELEKLRKKCQMLTEENHRLQKTLKKNRIPHSQLIDNVYLHTQVSTLEWQLKQTESNRQMYRSLMEQVVRFLDRTRKSLDILHKKSSTKDKKRVPRSRSVHTVHTDSSPSPGASTTSSSSSPESSRFTRAKSANQISPSPTSLKDFSWSCTRKNDSMNSTPLRSDPAPKQDSSQTYNEIIYRRPKLTDFDPDEMPPEKLSQEAFRLMRTVQSLLTMREPDLARIISNEDNNSPSREEHLNSNDMSLSLRSSNFVNSTPLTNPFSISSSNDRGNESSKEENSRSLCKSSPSNIEAHDNRLTPLPCARRSLDATSLNFGSSKTTGDDEILSSPKNSDSIAKKEFSGSTPKNAKKAENDAIKMRPKPSNSPSSAEDESGFSSMSSFQEVGLPSALPFSPIKGCHTEVGLPEKPVEKARHRRWSSTPAEIQAFLKRHRGCFSGSQTTKESLSVWV